ncbi:caspase family protein [Streptomyces sp. CS7]|uniref:caspase, EACC1-associated type n=1 Tax=Streptomyces sp. CS-7 TaxID=2906769 RepID=UPI0021B2A7A4|nr:caspase family protein [Streptomyces sp. CS-7]MCT6779253.1 caspase family protein [Streptomyces sp. CS-7]
MTSGTGRSRAVLFGVHEYDELAALDGVQRNIPELLTLLTSQDVGGLAREDCTEVPHDASQQELLDALHDAAEQATDLLLVYYAGHGHFGGSDRSFFLATRTSSVQRAYRSVNYDDVRDLVSGAAARRKVVIVDSCFSGRALSMSDETAPTQAEMEISGACVLTSAAETELSLCLPEGSVFTMALTALLSEGLSGELTGGRLGEHLPDLTMTDVFNALHGRLNGRTVDGRRVPLPKMSSRDHGHQIVLAKNRAFTGSLLGQGGSPTASVPEDHEWVAAARDHPLWNYVADERGLSLLRDTATALVARAASASAREEGELLEDPWRSPSYTDRVAEWTDSLLLDSSLRPEESELSAAEVFLLVTHPYLHNVFWKRNARRYHSVEPTHLTEAQSTSSARRDYERFLRAYPRLVRRALRTSGEGASDAIGWWLFHRWLIRQPRLYEPSAVEALLDDLAVPLGKCSLREKRLVEEVMDPRLVARLLRAPQLPGSQKEEKVRPTTVGVAETAQRVRAHQLAEMLRIAHFFAIDPITLSELVVDHIGIGYAVDLPDLHSTLENVRWDSNGRTRILSATCHHLAVDLGLRQHASALDTHLARIDISTGDEERPALLRNLPLHATADQVTPATETSGRPAYASTELRFRLADDRIQELLMGEELYGDPALAIRELYQNALDACRYRDARTRYLRATGSDTAPYEGEISFTQGIDDQGPFLECRDNGIGMGEVELRDVFSHAGMRFADLPEYIEERARWEEHGIAMHPNSQFGVGVLSYFMLADDITVTTCRLTPDGLPGQHLRVEIAGPGSLFRIQPLDRCTEAYTSVRLRLRSSDATSCVDVLRRILWLSEFKVTATEEGEEPSVWRPDILSDVAPLGGLDAYTEESVRKEDARAAATSTPAVWWCNTQGAVLADGLWAGQGLFGAVVNLSGARTPRLTVDRRRIIEPNMPEVELMLRQEIPSLLADGVDVFEHSWLKRFLHTSPSVADDIFAEAVRIRFAPWRLAGREVDITRSGFFTGDDSLDLDMDQGGYSPSIYATASSARAFRDRALTDAGFFPGFTTSRTSPLALPRPSDTFFLLPFDPGNARPVWSRSVFQDGTSVGIGMLTKASAGADRPIEEVAVRLAELGFSVPAPPFPLLDENDVRIISSELDGWSPWLDPQELVHPEHVLRAAHQLGRTAEHIVERLTALGYKTPSLAVTAPGPDDLLILSVDLDGQAPWISVETPVVPHHIESAAASTNRSVVDVAGRLEALGFAVPALPFPSVRDSDRDFIGAGARWEFRQSMPHPAQIVQAARDAGRSVEDVTDRLSALGYTVPSPLPTPHPEDLRLLSQQRTGQAPWLPLDRTVHPAQIAMAARTVGHPAAYVGARLTAYGYLLPDTDPLDLDPVDLHLISRDLDSQPPWLAHGGVVPLIHVAQAAAAMELHPDAIADRLEQLGYRLPDYVVRSTEAPVKE